MVFALAGVQRRARELVAGCHSQQGSPVLPEKPLSTTVLYGHAGGGRVCRTCCVITVTDGHLEIKIYIYLLLQYCS